MKSIFDMPWQPLANATTEGESRPVHERNGNEIRIKLLIVEDDAPVRQSLANFFLARKYEVHEAENGFEALKMIDKHPVDIIICDIRMPVLDGIGLLKEVSQKFPAIDVIMVTGYSDVESAIAATRYRACEYIKKPYDISEIYRLVKRIEKQKEMKAEIEEKKKQLARARHIASLGALTAAIMHEINNPNTFVLGNAQFLQQRLLPFLSQENIDSRLSAETGLSAKDFEKTVSGIVCGAHRIDQVINCSMHALLRKDRAPEFVELGETLRKFLSDFETRENPKVPIQTHFPVTPVHVKASAAEITQIAYNLLKNAVEAVSGRPGGRITLSAGLSGPSEAYLQIEDNAGGVAAQIAEQLFEPFVTTKLDRHARGLGLHIVHQIAENLDGKVELRNSPGRGACFIVHFLVSEPTS